MRSMHSQSSLTGEDDAAVSMSGSKDSLDDLDQFVPCCKITSPSNPVIFDSGLIFLPDYSSKRLIQRKLKPAPKILTPMLSSSMENILEEEKEAKVIQYLDEFSAPFSFFPQNGFSYYTFTCSRDKMKSEEESCDGNGKEELGCEETKQPVVVPDSGSDTTTGHVKEKAKPEDTDSRIVNLSDIRKQATDKARQRKTDPILWENVKKVNKSLAKSSLSLRSAASHTLAATSPATPRTGRVLSTTAISSSHSPCMTPLSRSPSSLANRKILSSNFVNHSTNNIMPSMVSRSLSIAQGDKRNYYNNNSRSHYSNAVSQCVSTCTLASDVDETVTTTAVTTTVNSETKQAAGKDVTVSTLNATTELGCGDKGHVAATAHNNNNNSFVNNNNNSAIATDVNSAVKSSDATLTISEEYRNVANESNVNESNMSSAVSYEFLLDW